MIKSLTIAFITSRKEPKIEWFMDSLNKQLREDYEQERPNWRGRTSVIVVSPYVEGDMLGIWGAQAFTESLYTRPKPTIWQGKHRITKEDWWAKSNAMNTAIILCNTEWIAFVDDRCVLTPIWLKCIQEAMDGNYGVCGSYEKRSTMKVEKGEIIDKGWFLGEDDREQHPFPIPTQDWYGGSCALPLEWCLEVNGFSEDLCDGLGSEDSMFGKTLRYAGFQYKYDSRMRIIEDRTPSEIDGALKRADKNSHLGKEAKSWSIVKAFYHKTSSQNSYDIRQHRARVRNGEDLQSIMPSASHYDWYDGQTIAEMT